MAETKRLMTEINLTNLEAILFAAAHPVNRKDTNVIRNPINSYFVMSNGSYNSCYVCAV